MTTKTLPAPVKGMKFLHAVRKEWDGRPVECTVTSVSRGTVYWSQSLWGDRRFKTPLDKWEQFCAEVTHVPERKAPQRSPRLSEEECRLLHEKAHAAGMAAGNAHQPEPMIVVQHADPLDDSSPVVRVYEPVWDGVCGFGWVTVRPGNSSYARWLRENTRAFRSEEGGVRLRVSRFGQSYEKKMAYAGAYAKVLQEAGINALADGRLD